ncbi:hypothetical protein QFC19_001888 [Naganishia cerealis]|uniref:Uncharacterized protein n=1 Tax=Naganishia cerealis TaxID=610337 RepID=A0ACC2WES2_9TREE|nr:hypothetical protein QFC19_001888 [Naganishia cerealis]
MAVYIALALEAIGDITASSEVSRLSVDGPEFDSRIQGGVLADGLAGMLKERFILAASLVFGMSNMLADGWLAHLFDGVKSDSKGLNGFLSSITIIVSAPYLSAFVVGCILWNILPDDPETIVRYDADQAALELGQLDKGDRDVPSVAYSQNGKATSEAEEDDFKALGASTRVEPVL